MLDSVSEMHSLLKERQDVAADVHVSLDEK